MPVLREQRQVSYSLKQRGIQNRKLAKSPNGSVSSGRSISSNDNDSFISSSPLYDSFPMRLNETDTAKSRDGLSAYEQRREQNVLERLEFLASLNIEDEKKNLLELAPAPKTKTSCCGIKTAKRKASPLQNNERRKSMRLQQKPVDTSVKVEELFFTAEAVETIEHGHHLEHYIPEKYRGSDWNETLQHIQNCSDEHKFSGWQMDSEKLLEIVKQMTFDSIVKVTPSRICAVAVHPCLDRNLILCGDTSGHLGVLATDRQDCNDGAWPLSVHSSCLYSVMVDMTRPYRVLTCSADGSLRMTDIQSNIMTEVYNCSDRGSLLRLAMHDNTVYVVCSSGEVIFTDLRATEKCTRKYLDKNVGLKLVTAHPTNFNYFATSNRNGHVGLWDRRMLIAGHPVCSYQHTLTLSDLNFSPITGNCLISTCRDNTICALELKNFLSIERKKSIRHDNFTGRWLSSMRASFIPGQEDLFITGSMDKRYRVVEVYSSQSGRLLHRLSDVQMQTYCPVVAAHPSVPLIVAANSSGRCHVFKTPS